MQTYLLLFRSIKRGDLQRSTIEAVRRDYLKLYDRRKKSFTRPRKGREVVAVEEAVRSHAHVPHTVLLNTLKQDFRHAAASTCKSELGNHWEQRQFHNKSWFKHTSSASVRSFNTQLGNSRFNSIRFDGQDNAKYNID